VEWRLNVSLAMAAPKKAATVALLLAGLRGEVIAEHSLLFGDRYFAGVELLSPILEKSRDCPSRYTQPRFPPVVRAQKDEAFRGHWDLPQQWVKLRVLFPRVVFE